MLPCFESGIPLLIARLNELPDRENVVLAYPDEGAWKRFHFHLAHTKFSEVICTKARAGGPSFGGGRGALGALAWPRLSEPSAEI